MLQIALWEPEIPPNTGNIARLCAATGCPLHLVGPLGFRIDEKSLRRAGLDYWDSVDLRRHDTLADFEKFVQDQGTRLFCLSAHASAPTACSSGPRRAACRRRCWSATVSGVTRFRCYREKCVV